MSFIVADRVKETTATTGTLDIVLSGAATGFQAFSGVLSSGDTTYYTVVSNTDWEVGLGIYRTGTNDIVRDTVLASSNAGSKITLTGTSTVFLTYPADKSVYKNINDQVVITPSGLIFSDSTVQTTAAAVSGDNVGVFVNNVGYITGTGGVNQVAIFDSATSVSGAQGIEIQTTGDPGLDIFRKAGQTTTLVNIYTENTGILTVIDENGYLGIGTGNPTYQLQVEGTGDFDTIRFSDGSTQTTAGAVSGDNISIFVNNTGYLTAHPAVSAASNSDNSGRTYIQDVLLDSYGHVTGISIATETVVDTDTTYTAGSGLQLNGTTFNALTATTSTSGITILTNTIDATETKALTPKGVNDAGYVVGPASGTDNAVVRFDGATGKLVQDSTVTIDDAGKIATPGLICGSIGLQLGSNNYMGFDSVTITGVTNSSPQNISFLGANISGTQYSTYLFMIRLANITTNEENGSAYFVRKSGTGDGSNWETFMWGSRDTAAGENPEIYIDTGVGSGGAVQVRLKSANPAGGDTVLAHIVAWRIDRGDNDIPAILPEAIWVNSRYASQRRLVYPIASGSMDFYLTGTSTLGIQTSGPASEALDVQNKAYIQSSYSAIDTNVDGATITFDLDAANTHTVTLGGNRILALSNDNVGQHFIIRLVQDGTGSRTVTWFSTIKWPGGLVPTLTTTGGKTDVFGFICTSAGNYDGYVIGYNL